MSDDLRAAVDFLAKQDRRTVSNWLELLVIDTVRAKLKNTFDDTGTIVGSREFQKRT
jgi:hypothetical protein